MSRRPARIRGLARQVAELVVRKNIAYGDSVGQAGDFLRLLYPRGIQPGQYADAVLLARVFDKCMRIATRKRAFGESPFIDIAGYALLGADQDAQARSIVVAEFPIRRLILDDMSRAIASDVDHAIVHGEGSAKARVPRGLYRVKVRRRK